MKTTLINPPTIQYIEQTSYIKKIQKQINQDNTKETLSHRAWRRGCGMDGGRKWTGLEPSVGEEADGEEGESEDDKASAAAAGGTVLGSEADLRDANSPDGSPTRRSSGRGRSSGELTAVPTAT